MPRGRKKETEKKLDSFEYESIGNINYETDQFDMTCFNLKSQFPIRLNRGDSKTVSTGIKVKVPHNMVGLVTGIPEMASKNEVVILGSPYLITPSDELREITVTLKNFGIMPKVINMGDVIGRFVLLQRGDFNIPYNVEPDDLAEEINKN